MQNLARFQTTSDFDREYLRNGTRYGLGLNLGLGLGLGLGLRLWVRVSQPITEMHGHIPVLSIYSYVNMCCFKLLMPSGWAVCNIFCHVVSFIWRSASEFSANCSIAKIVKFCSECPAWLKWRPIPRVRVRVRLGFIIAFARWRHYRHGHTQPP